MKKNTLIILGLGVTTICVTAAAMINKKKKLKKRDEVANYDIDDYVKKCEEINNKVQKISSFDDESKMSKELESNDDEDLDLFLEGKKDTYIIN